jgi:hypothetical protein
MSNDFFDIETPLSAPMLSATEPTHPGYRRRAVAGIALELHRRRAIAARKITKSKNRAAKMARRKNRR